MRAPWEGSRRLVLPLLGTFLLASCALVGDVLHGTRDRIIFSHKEHLDPKAGDKAAPGKAHEAQTQMCAKCHYATPADRRGEEPGEPLEASCLVCHKEWKDKKDCGKCHTDPDAPRTYAWFPGKPKVSYSHARHEERISRLEDKACDSCHDSAWSEPSDSGGVRLLQDPESRWHETCFKCHLMRTEWDRMNCTKCHDRLNESDGPRPLSRFRHEGSWIRNHGDELAGRPDGLALCARCHDRAYCGDCHDARDERRLRPELKWPERPDRAFIHRGDFINRHAFEARAGSLDCLRCHSAGGFCRECHEQRGVAESTRGSTGATGRYHNGTPTQFVIDAASPFHHARTARRDAVLCATCHDRGQQTNCIQCHSAKGNNTTEGGSPHPKGFNSAIEKSQKPCSFCHQGGR